MDWQQVGTAVIAVAGVVGSYVNYRKGLKKTISEALQQNNAELQDLAATRLEEIQALEARSKNARAALDTANSELAAVTSLYNRALGTIRHYSDEVLQLRANVDALEADNKALRQRIAGLEQMAKPTGGPQ